MNQANTLWRVRPAGTSHEGRAVSWERLAAAIARQEVGELDEVRGPRDSQWQPVAEHAQAAQQIPREARSMTREVEDAESDMTPMIDVTFQLLIFFMIAATYTLQKTLDLPSLKRDAEGAGAVTIEKLKEENVLAAINAEGGVSIQDKLVPLENVERAIRDAGRQMKSAELVLDVDDRAVHDVVVKVLDAAAAAQIEKVLFVSRKASTAKP